MRIKLLLLLVVPVVILLLSTMTFAKTYNAYNVIQITNDGYDKSSSNLTESGEVVWYDWGGDENNARIYLYDGTNTVVIVDPFTVGHVHINSSGQVVWDGTMNWCADSDCGDDEIYLFDGTNNTQITDNSNNDSFSEINSNGQVVWHGYDGNDNEIFLYDGGTTTQLTSNSYADYVPKINDSGQVVWWGYDGNDYEIFLYNGTPNPPPLTNNSYDDEFAMINSNGQVVWQGFDGNDLEIFLYDGTAIIQLTNNLFDDERPNINDSGQVVWHGYDGNDYEIFLYNGTPNPPPLTNNSYDDLYPYINSTGLVGWYGRVDGDDREVFLYDGTTINQITDNSIEDGVPKINSAGQLLWKAGTIPSNDLFLATPSPVLTLPDEINMEATDETGAIVDYIDSVTAVDGDGNSLTVSCNPASGSNFELGATAVTCSATDSWGNTASGDFHIIVSTNPNGSAGGQISKNDGGTLTTPDGSVTIEIPPGALSEDAYISISQTGTSFELTSNAGNGTSVFGVVIGPEGTMFNSFITITFTWDDENNDGTIDGTNIKEENVRVIKDGVALTLQCKNESGCNTADNYFEFQVNSLSEFALAYFDWQAPEIMDMEATFGATVAIGSPNTITATVSDIGTGYTPIGKVECVIDNDPSTAFEMDPADGDFDSVTEVATGSIGFFEEAGVHRVCVKAWDKHENVECPEKCMLIAVYDPSAGFVTGGGWINSPEGAYVPDPSLAGKATFGFVSKYKQGATEPNGQTEFQFETADLNFHSSSYQWLVVTGADDANFKGTGTINGQLDPNENPYKFRLWAGDGEPDTFRIRIWIEDDLGNETDIYDNGPDQDIGGGSIVIHAK